MKQDQMSMAASIETRVPFLDHQLVEFAARLPDAWKLSGFWGLRATTRERGSWPHKSSAISEAMAGRWRQRIGERPKALKNLGFARGWALC